MFNSDGNENSPENSPENRGEGELVETWQRFVQGLLGVLALVGALVMAHYYAPPETAGLEQQVHQLSRQVADLEREQSFSAAAVDDAGTRSPKRSEPCLRPTWPTTTFA